MACTRAANILNECTSELGTIAFFLETGGARVLI